MTHITTTTRIRLGFIVPSGEAVRRLSETDLSLALHRHATGDWGDCGEEARERNRYALQTGNDLFSIYRSETGEQFCVVTAGDGLSTSIRMLDEYQELIAQLH